MKTPTNAAFSKFIKAHYRFVKDTHPRWTHEQILRELSRQIRALPRYKKPGPKKGSRPCAKAVAKAVAKAHAEGARRR